MKISNGKMNIWSSLVLLQVLHYGLAYRILAVIPFSGKSHYLNMQPIVQEMADRGHDVTVIATYPEKNPNYKQIVLERKLIWEGLGEKFDLFALNTAVFEKTMDLAWRGTFFTTETALNSSLLQDFIKNDKSHFDLIFTEIFYQEALYMFAHKYNAPIIGFCTMGFTQSIGDIMGSPLILNYMAHEYLTFGSPMTVAQKFRNIYSTLYELFWRHFYHLPLHQKLAEKHFGHLPGKLPQIADIEKNISLILLNTHYSSDIVRPYVPGIIEVGGAHIRKPKELPENLQKYLDESKDGAIYFSLGSNIQCKEMPKEKLEIFLRVFGKLKQRVLWKWEEEIMKGKPENVMTGKWMPQSDILAHPNIKLFITHGGLLSTLEATARGVPVIGIPFFGDQHLNIEKVEKRGFGLKLPYKDLTEEALENALRTILDNSTYEARARELADRFNDRPTSALDTAMYWIEYVIRHKGADFMRSPVVDMSRLEYHTFQLGCLGLLILLFISFLFFIVINIILYVIKSRQLSSKGVSLNMSGKKND